jgi:hypothetical protein
MTVLKDGWDIFAAALRSVLIRPAIAAALWFGIGSVFFLLELARSAAILRGGEPRVLGGVVIEALLVAILAVAWHRIVLRPGQPDFRIGRWFRYALEWVLNGIIFIFLLLPLFGLLLVGIGAATDVALYGSINLDAGIMETLSVWSLNLFEGPGALLTYFVIGTGFLWLLYRMALGLPHIAVEDRRLGLRQSWARTRPLARPIAGLAVIASSAQLPLLYGPLLFPTWGYAETLWDDLPVVIVLSFGYVAVILFGAAILTELYIRTQPSSPPEPV